LLEAVGINIKQIVGWNQRFAIVEELLVPTYPQITKDGLEWINNLVPLEESQPSQYGAFIYLSRQKQKHRKIANEYEVQNLLQKHGFSTVFPEEISFEEQVDIARKAKILFGPQGSAFTLQIFMPPGHLLEAFPRNRVHLFNRQVAMIKRHQHFALVDARGPDPSVGSVTNVMVDVVELERHLNFLVKK